ncbi:MAG: alpha/beta fold hydrolase [Actinobacteria bacterium]|nr:alpha/beta fold hydrolase [Actinomycetota bacterium]
MIHRRVLGDGVELAVTSTGPEDAPALVVGHGVASTSRFAREAFTGPATRAGFRLVTYDLRGHGDSSPVPAAVDHALDRHVADLDAVVAAVAGGQPVTVAGISLGGHVAVAWAAAHAGTARAAVACLPAWTGRAVPGEGAHAAVAAEVARAGVDGMIASFREDDTMEPWLRTVLLRDWPVHDADSLTAALVALDGGLAPTEAELRTLPVPLGLVAWPDDAGHPIAVAREWRDQAPRAALEELALTALAASPEPLGAAAVRALRALGVEPQGRRARGRP